jgi:hypothetical protein
MTSCTEADIPLLIRIIKNAHKVIVADALISDNVFTFLEIRSQEQFYIKNNFKKYEGIKAHRLKDENDFKEELERHIIIINTSFLVAIRAELSKNIFIIVMKKQTRRQRAI